MLKSLLYIYVILSFFNACRPKSIDTNDFNLRDSVLKAYLHQTESLFQSDRKFYNLDSNDFNYKILKSYYYNDTVYLRRVYKDITDLSNNSDNAISDSFWNRNIPSLKTLHIDEGYQFQYSETFCPLVCVITIVKASDSIRLISLVYKFTEFEDKRIEAFEIVEKKEKVLKESDWLKLSETLTYADYWNLKYRNSECVLDGAYLKILGVKRNTKFNFIEKTNSVQRTLFKNAAIYKSFLYALELADIQNVCDD